MQYKHFSIEEREKVQELLWQKVSVRTIAGVLSRNPSSVSREITRNVPLQRKYTPRLANERAFLNRTCRGRKLRLKSGFIRRYVVSGLKAGCSPEQIAGRLSVDHPRESISHEAIYQYVYHHVHRQGRGELKPHYHDLRPYLKRRHKRRGQKGMRTVRRIFKQKGLSIDLRPNEVNTRQTLGHWEGDSIVSRHSVVGLNTLVERKTGLVFITKIQNGTANETANAVVHRLRTIPKEFRKTLTVDNGNENAGHEMITNALRTTCYFAHPYHSWERGTNENTNGLIRWYFPKGTDFAIIPDEAIKAVEDALNNRPRKRLGWKTPLEAFNESVALTC